MKGFWFWCWMFWVIGAAAQDDKTIFKHLNTDDGLPSNYISSIIQDHEGYIWMGTMDGLARYNGYGFLTFRNSVSDTFSLVHNNVRCIVQDRKNNFWVGTQNGLVYFDLDTYRFKRLPSKFKDNIASLWITSLCVIDEHNLLVGTFTNGFFIYDPVSERIKSFEHDPPPSNSLINNSVRSILPDAYGHVWLATDGGLDCFDLRNKRFTHSLQGKTLQHLCMDAHGYAFASPFDEAELYKVNTRTGAVETIRLLDAYRKKAKNIFFDSEGNSWMGIVDEGMVFYNQKSKQSHNWYYSRVNPDGINSNTPLYVYEDKWGNIWIGTFDGGLNVLEKQRKPFIQIKKNYLEHGLQSNHVRSLYQDEDGEVWVGTKVDGMLSRFDLKTQTFVHYKQQAGVAGSLNDKFVLSITSAKPGFLWVGTLYGGLNLFNKKTGRFTEIKGEGFDVKAIYALHQDRDGHLWIGTSERGLFEYDPSTGVFTHYSNSKSPGSISDDRIRVIFETSEHEMWVGTFNGLNLWDKKTKKFKRFMNDPSNKNSISDNNIYSICEDRKHQLWIGISNGLNLYDKRTQSFKSLSPKNDDMSLSVRGICDDLQGNIWLSTGSGIVKYDPIQNKYRKYTKEDGLNSNEFLAYSYLKTRTGELLFGCDNGMVYFDPMKIEDNKVVPTVVIDDFKIFNREVPVGQEGSPLIKHISRSKQITLDYMQSVFTFGFTSLNLSSPEKNKYAYKMEGFDKEWNNVGAQRTATYTNLPAGRYIFRVKASNNDGLWNEKGASIQLTILPPPWKTWWAYCFYILMIVLGLLKYRELTIKKYRQEKERENDQMKLKLFMNISHEFRTPLSLMIHPIDKIHAAKQIEDVYSSIDVVQRSAWKMLNLVNQLLDFRKIDQHKSVLLLNKLDIVPLSKRICSLFEDIAKLKSIDLKFESEISSQEVWLDADKYEKILDNLLSNALKFTENGGTIKVSICRSHAKTPTFWQSIFRRDKASEMIDIRVSDTGIGMSKEDSKNIFELFFQADESKAGTGIGLNYVKSLVELHQGQVLVESELGKGSTFIVRLPLGDKHLKPSQMHHQPMDEKQTYNKALLEALRYDIENMEHETKEDDLDTEEEKGTNSRSNLVVLVVEDNKTLRGQLVEEFKKSYTVKEASNGVEGMERARRFLPDLIISDVMMPKMDGVEMCRQLKSDLETCHIPVIMLTAKSTIENRIEGFQTGADDYIPKPFNMQLLVLKIQNLLHSRSLLKEKYLNSKMIAPASEYTTNNLDEAFLEKMTGIVIANIENSEFSIHDLREEMAMSRTNLFNKIQALTGNNPSNFVRTVRLKYAAQLLLQPHQSIKDICFQCGFSSPAYFTKTFRELFGQTPLEYIEANRKPGSSSKTDNEQ